MGVCQPTLPGYPFSQAGKLAKQADSLQNSRIKQGNTKLAHLVL